ncbi:reverse transcriptase family protein [Pseudomonas sp. D2002]|uniref:reverse transcriptase family protein n=1 Tax=Pseudomonas sp. D2002 TaxID=2726980 RepID=UPI003527A99C
MIFPHYLQGGIKDADDPRDYIENSKLHAGSKHLISLDIKDFYNNIKQSSVLDVFKYFFKFPEDVSSLLTQLVTLNGRVPQGACTSSYVANLILHNSEYSIVSRLRSKGFTYTRLLDDVTISSKQHLDQNTSTKLIIEVAAIFKKHGLRLNSKKTRIERSDDLKAKYEVTGVWVGHGVPKVRREDRRHIRHLVFICEKEHETDRYSDSYHELWNRVSGQVARLTRLKHSQAKALRSKLSLVLPLYDDRQKSQLIFETEKLIRKSTSSHVRPGVIDAYNKVIYRLGILGRTDKATAKTLRKTLKARFSSMPTKSEIWE